MVRLHLEPLLELLHGEVRVARQLADLHRGQLVRGHVYAAKAPVPVPNPPTRADLRLEGVGFKVRGGGFEEMGQEGVRWGSGGGQEGGEFAPHGGSLVGLDTDI
eukprot:1186205-Prorocentrum_minimum.AAC.2